MRPVTQILLALIASVLLTLVLVRSAKVHGHHTGDHDFLKPQGFHTEAVPRIGGLAVIVAMGLALLPGWWRPTPTWVMGCSLVLCGLPAFGVGFVHDLRETVTPRGRLLATAVSALLAFYFLGAAIVDTAIPGLDWVASFALGSLFLTLFTVAGIANAVNIIDGFNGLASMCVMLMLSALAYVAFQVNDGVIGGLALLGIAAVAGFFLWNYPHGLIFLGDGGAYFLGFWVAELGILLLVRNPEVSPIFPLLVCIYPVFETVFSIYRRMVVRGRPALMPDGIHLHSLIYRRVTRWAVGPNSRHAATLGNSMTSPVLWALSMLSILPSLLFWDDTAMLSVFLLGFVLAYLQLYSRIVQFRAPGVLKRIGQRPAVVGRPR